MMSSVIFAYIYHKKKLLALSKQIKIHCILSFHIRRRVFFFQKICNDSALQESTFFAYNFIH